MNPIENVWDIMKKEIANQMLSKKRCGSEYVKHGIVLEELYNLKPRRIADLIKANRGQTKY